MILGLQCTFSCEVHEQLPLHLSHGISYRALGINSPIWPFHRNNSILPYLPHSRSNDRAKRPSMRVLTATPPDDDDGGHSLDTRS
jgi:hypothetical protein